MYVMKKGLCDFVSPANNRWARKNSQSPFAVGCDKTTLLTLTSCHACAQVNGRIYVVLHAHIKNSMCSVLLIS